MMLAVFSLVAALAGGTVTGVVQDATGAVVPGASVVAKTADGERSAVSGPDGRFTIDSTTGSVTLVVATVGVVGPHVSHLDTFVTQSPPELAALFALGVVAAGIVSTSAARRSWPWAWLALAAAAPAIAATSAGAHQQIVATAAAAPDNSLLDDGEPAGGTGVDPGPATQ